MTMTGLELHADNVTVGDRIRGLREEVVTNMMDSIVAVGQLEPILVRRHKGAYYLIAGQHRLEACRRLKRLVRAEAYEGAAATAVFELAEIDENLCRADLTAAERKLHIARRKELYEQLHPEAAKGKTGRGRPKGEGAAAFADETAKRSGRGRSSVHRDIAHARKVTVLSKIAGTSLDSDVEIEALSKMAPAEQERAVERLKAGEIKSVKHLLKTQRRAERERELADKVAGLPALSDNWLRFDARGALQVGKAAEHLVCADLLMKGYNVSLASQGSPYDAIVEVDGQLLRIQIKSAQWTRNVNSQGRNERLAYSFSSRDQGAWTGADIVACVAMDIMGVAYFAAHDCPATIQLDATSERLDNNYVRTFDRPFHEWPFDEALAKARAVSAYIELRKVFPPFPRRRYGVVVADPPWAFDTYSELGMDRSAENHYPTLSVDVIKGIGPFVPAADDAALFLWATSPMLEHALSVMGAWGFDYKSHYVWAKDKEGTGYWFREKHELLLIGTRGNVPAPAPGTQWGSVVSAPRGKHSEKPEVFLQMIEGYFPNVPKIELNRRGPPRPGWDAWGNEVEDAT